MADSPYFDSTYFNGSYFDVLAVTSGGGQGKAPKRKRQFVVKPTRPEPPEEVNEDAEILLLL